MEPKVAVLMPVYNRQGEMEKSIKSLNNQGILFDLIIIDDGSKPCLMKPENPSGGEVFLFRHHANEGIVAALNLGLKFINTKGYKYIARFDAGDLCYANRLKVQKDYLDEHPSCMLLGTQVRLVNKDWNDIGGWKVPENSEDIRRTIHYRACFVHSAVMIRRTVLEKVGHYNNKYPHAEDYDLFMRITQGYECSNLSEVFLDCEFTDLDSISRQNQYVQSRSILKILMNYFEWKIYESYLGLLKNIIFLYIPANYKIKIKIQFWKVFFNIVKHNENSMD